MLPQTDLEYFGDDGDRMHMMFNFQVNQSMFYALASADARPLAKAIEKTSEVANNSETNFFIVIDLSPVSNVRLRR